MLKNVRSLVRFSIGSLLLCLVLPPADFAQKTASKPSPDALGRLTPRSSVTGFLQMCSRHDYQRAAAYLDLREIPRNRRAQLGPELARDLESILNADSHFNVLSLSQDPQGSLSDDPNPEIEHVASITRDGETFILELEHVQQAPDQPQIWLFDPATVAALPQLISTQTGSGLASYLPGFLTSIYFLETPLWKWIALLIVAIVLIVAFRLVVRIMLFLLTRFETRLKHPARWLWIQAVLEPWIVFFFSLIFGIIEQFINPSAVSRLYISRAILLAIVAAFAWGFINLVDLFLLRIDRTLDPRQRIALHSLIYLGRRTAKVVIAVLATIVVLNNWGYQLTTIIAGLGVGGIAVALAAQSTIANVFGGVSVIGDRPVMVGDYGNFGGLLGTVEDIGMRSTRIRTPQRTLVSIPNSSFATMNLENYSVRDKILFNPTLQIKRTTPKDQIRHLIVELEEMLKKNNKIEVGRSPVRVNHLSSNSFHLEIFAYVLTVDTDEFNRIQAELFLAIDDVLNSLGIELT
jgi:MscS family membrane protein